MSTPVILLVSLIVLMIIGVPVAWSLSLSCVAALSGSATATTAAIGGLMYPEMERRGYPKDFSAQTVVVSIMVVTAQLFGWIVTFLPNLVK